MTPQVSRISLRIFPSGLVELLRDEPDLVVEHVQLLSKRLFLEALALLRLRLVVSVLDALQLRVAAWAFVLTRFGLQSLHHVEQLVSVMLNTH